MAAAPASASLTSSVRSGSVQAPISASRSIANPANSNNSRCLVSFGRPDSFNLGNVAVRSAGRQITPRALPSSRPSRVDRECVRVRAKANVVTSAAATDSEASELVDKLLSMVNDTDRGAAMSDEGRAAVTAIVEQLEAVGLEEPLKSPLVFGAWEVAYTSRPTAAGGYYRSIIGRKLPRSKDLVQTIYPPNGVDNLVEFDALSLIPGSISLKGKFEPLDNKWVRAVFEAPNLALGPLKFSYGGESSVRLSVSYLDERVRIGRGSQGSIFVFARRT
ncbi:hypothetical protein CLOM_g11177 [Closterium sp. NIES-68]|nr:hypothetical protein CLOM_g11177 [Closterium sp. NIES-68]GJP79602.1 hypothetical protein CLOP_g9817 [Closterium sp. NIES-67]